MRVYTQVPYMHKPKKGNPDRREWSSKREISRRRSVLLMNSSRYGMAVDGEPQHKKP